MRIVLASAAAALALVAVPATANTETVEVRVAYGDLDVTTAEGRAALDQRVHRVAVKACEVADPLGRAPAKTDWNCVAATKRAALAQVERSDAPRTAMGAD